MKHIPTKTIAVFLFLFVFAMGTAGAADLTVTVKNLTHGIYFTPLLVTAHDGNTHLFMPGMAASDELTAMAEGGAIGGLADLLGGMDADTVGNPAGGLLGPGMTVDGITLNTDGTGNTHLSVVAMMLPTNDGFIGLNAVPIPTAPGRHTYYLNGYDAGTEANGELLNTADGGMPGVPGIPAAPGENAGVGGTGVTTEEANTTVHIHRGVLGDTDPNGGISDLDSTIHRWLNPVAAVIIDIQ